MECRHELPYFLRLARDTDRCLPRFRWVGCQLDALRKCFTIGSLRKALNTLPKTLDDTYGRILTNIDEEYTQDAMKVLQCLVYSPRPMRISEVAEVLAVDIDDKQRFDIERRLPEPADILRICSSLVTASPRRKASKNRYDLDSTSGPHDPNSLDAPEDLDSDYPDELDPGYSDSSSSGDLDRTLRLAHFSVKEYLTSERIQAGPVSTFHLAEAPAALFMAKTCLFYLLQFRSPGLLSTNTPRDFPLARFAAEYWIRYATLAQAHGEQTLDSLILQLLDSRDECFANWIRIYDPDAPWEPPNFTRNIETIAPPLYYMSLSGLVGATKILLERGADANELSRGRGNAAQAGASQGRGVVLRWLPGNGASVNCQGGECGNALVAAVSNGNEPVLTLLLENGADIERKGKEGHTPLTYAALKGNEAVVRLLIGKGANIEATNRRGRQR